MADRSPLIFSLDGIDVNLLRLFCLIVECNGFSAAQARANISAASISSKMSALESRLGLTLCQRGRSGFKLTLEGQRVYEAASSIFQVHNSFIRDIGQLRKKLSGRIKVGVADSTVTNKDMLLSSAIGRFHDKHSDVYLSIQIQDPPHLERSILDDSIQIAIAPFYHKVPGLLYQPFFDELHYLYCGREHPLFEKAPHDLDATSLRQCKYVLRTHVPSSIDLPTERPVDSASVSDMEAMMHLILSGRFVGFLPVHFAQHWVEADKIRPLLPTQISHVSQFEVATKRDRMNERLTQAFLSELVNNGRLPR
jgi:DNA-binding transcriptional LysR family regulator